MTRQAPFIHVGATRKSQKAALLGILSIIDATGGRGDEVAVKALDVFAQNAITRNITIQDSTFAETVHQGSDYKPGVNGTSNAGFFRGNK